MKDIDDTELEDSQLAVRVPKHLKDFFALHSKREGETQQDLEVSKDGFIGSSAVAYKKMYAKVAGQLLQGKDVTIEYTTINNLLNKDVDNQAKDHTVLATTVYDKLQEINGNVLIGNAMLKGRLIT